MYSAIHFLKDKKFLILFYILLMTFISLVLFLDGLANVGIDNILYIDGVSTVFFAFYLVAGYLYRRKYYHAFQKPVVHGDMGDMMYVFPEPQSNEQRFFTDILKQLDHYQRKKTEKLILDLKDNQEFIVQWVHEIKTPIAASKLIIDNSAGKPKEAILDKLEDELAKINRLVEQVLYYSRADSFSKDYFISDVHLDKVVKESVKNHAKIFINKRIQIRLHNLDTSVLTDKKWLSYIVDQIISNALKYTDKEGTIECYCEKDKKEQLLIIKDNGIGIKAEDLERVFEKGFTGTAGRINTTSTGLGLYLAKKLARKLSHDISVQAEEEKGTKVTIHFPHPGNFYMTRM